MAKWCFYPLSEFFYLCVYDPFAVRSGGSQNNYGLYLLDAFGNKILLYRDSSISAMDPIPWRERDREMIIPHQSLRGKPLASGQKFIPENIDLPKTARVGLVILAGNDPRMSVLEGKPVSWLVTRPSADLTGHSNVHTVDFSSVADMSQFDKGYLVRYVCSPDDREAQLRVAAQGYSTMICPVVYLNGECVFRDILSPRFGKDRGEVPVRLREGKNILAARVNHEKWQWAISLELVAEGLSY